jgi:hypothetical protein
MEGGFVECVQVVGVAETCENYGEHYDNELNHVGLLVLVEVVGQSS